LSVVGRSMHTADVLRAKFDSRSDPRQDAAELFCSAHETGISANNGRDDMFTLVQ